MAFTEVDTQITEIMRTFGLADHFTIVWHGNISERHNHSFVMNVDMTSVTHKQHVLWNGPLQHNNYNLCSEDMAVYISIKTLFAWMMKCDSRSVEVVENRIYVNHCPKYLQMTVNDLYWMMRAPHFTLDMNVDDADSALATKDTLAVAELLFHHFPFPIPMDTLAHKYWEYFGDELKLQGDLEHPCIKLQSNQLSLIHTKLFLSSFSSQKRFEICKEKIIYMMDSFPNGIMNVDYLKLILCGMGVSIADSGLSPQQRSQLNESMFLFAVDARTDRSYRYLLWMPEPDAVRILCGLPMDWILPHTQAAEYIRNMAMRRNIFKVWMSIRQRLQQLTVWHDELCWRVSIIARCRLYQPSYIQALQRSIGSIRARQTYMTRMLREHQ